MNPGTRQGLRIAVAAVLTIAALMAIAVAWFGRAAATGRDRAELRAEAFCAAIAIGADIASAPGSPAAPHVSVDASTGAAEYRYRFFGSQTAVADCRVSVDASGRIVAKRDGPAEPFRPDRVLGDKAAVQR